MLFPPRIHTFYVSIPIERMGEKVVDIQQKHSMFFHSTIQMGCEQSFLYFPQATNIQRRIVVYQANLCIRLVTTRGNEELNLQFLMTAQQTHLMRQTHLLHHYLA